METTLLLKIYLKEENKLKETKEYNIYYEVKQVIKQAKKNSQNLRENRIHKTAEKKRNSASE